MNAASPIESVPPEFLKNLLICLGFLVTIGINLYALWKSKREVSGMVRTQAVEAFATQNELRELESKHEAATERLLAAGEKRAETINARLEKQFEKFDRKLTELRAELRAEFGELNRNAFQRLNQQGERIAALETSKPAA